MQGGHVEGLKQDLWRRNGKQWLSGQCTEELVSLPLVLGHSEPLCRGTWLPQRARHGVRAQTGLHPSSGAGALGRCFPVCNVGLHPSQGPYRADPTDRHGTEGFPSSSRPPCHHDADDAELPVPLRSPHCPLLASVLSALRLQADVTRIPTLRHGVIYLFYDTDRKLSVTVCYLRTRRLVHTQLGPERCPRY